MSLALAFLSIFIGAIYGFVGGIICSLADSLGPGWRSFTLMLLGIIQLASGVLFIGMGIMAFWGPK